MNWLENKERSMSERNTVSFIKKIILIIIAAVRAVAYVGQWMCLLKSGTRTIEKAHLKCQSIYSLFRLKCACRFLKDLEEAQRAAKSTTNMV